MKQVGVCTNDDRSTDLTPSEPSLSFPTPLPTYDQMIVSIALSMTRVCITIQQWLQYMTSELGRLSTHPYAVSIASSLPIPTLDEKALRGDTPNDMNRLYTKRATFKERSYAPRPLLKLHKHMYKWSVRALGNEGYMSSN